MERRATAWWREEGAVGERWTHEGFVRISSIREADAPRVAVILSRERMTNFVDLGSACARTPSYVWKGIQRGDFANL